MVASFVRGRTVIGAVMGRWMMIWALKLTPGPPACSNEIGPPQQDSRADGRTLGTSDDDYRGGKSAPFLLSHPL
jgi:hypothetical protein